jgi:hypothetical protein
MTNEFSHQKEEFLSLRKEVENALADLSSLERNCVLAMSAVYAWLISQASLGGLDKRIGWGIPVLLSVFSALRGYSLNRHLGVIGSYIRNIEKLNKPGGADAIGWETFFQETGRGIQTKIRIWFWGVLIAFAFGVWVIKLCVR